MQVFFQWPSHLELVNGNIHYRKRLVGCNSFSFQRWKWGRPIEKEKNWYSFRLQSFSTSELFGGNIATWQIQKQVKSTAVQQKMWWSPTLEKMFQEMLQNRSRKTLKDCKPIIKKQRQYRTKIDQYLTNSTIQLNQNWTKYRFESQVCSNYCTLSDVCGAFYVQGRDSVAYCKDPFVSVEICSTYLCIYMKILFPTPKYVKWFLQI